MPGRQEPTERRYRIDANGMVSNSSFAGLGKASVTERHRVTIADLVGRALSNANTSPEIWLKDKQNLGARTAAALEPFVQDGFW